MRNIIGPPVLGDDFFGRDQELANAWRLLENGMSLRISAPRRVGKTSFVRRLHQDCESRDWTGFYVNVEDKDNEVGFIEALLENLAIQKSWSKRLGSKAKDALISGLKSVESLNTPIGDLKFKWAHDENTISIKKEINELLFTFGEGIIIVDELPVLLNRMLKQENGHQRVTDLLHWLRSLRQLSGVKMYWIFCGSVSLDSFVKRHNLSLTINDTTKFDLGAYTPEVAHAFLEEICKNSGPVLSPEIRKELIDLTGDPLPYYLQLLFNKLSSLARNRPMGIPIRSEDLAQAFEQAANESNLSTWLERLSDQLSPEDARLAKALLDALSKKATGLKRTQLEQILVKHNVALEQSKDKSTELLRMLESDGYLLHQQGLYGFRSPLLRMFWYKTRIA